MNLENEIKGIIALLSSIGSTAQTASLTGSMKRGAKACIRSYNITLKRLKELDLVSEALFQPLDEESEFDEVGVLSKQLSAFLKGQFDLKEKDDLNTSEFLRSIASSIALKPNKAKTEKESPETRHKAKG